MCLNSGQQDKWLKQQAALATDMLLISQGNIENRRLKERGGRAHTLGDGLPGTISKQLTLGMSGSCCKTSKVIVTRESVNLESLDVGDEEGRDHVGGLHQEKRRVTTSVKMFCTFYIGISPRKTKMLSAPYLY